MSEKRNRPSQGLTARTKGAEKGEGYVNILVAFDGQYGPLWSFSRDLTEEKLIEVFRACKGGKESTMNIKLYNYNTKTGNTNAQEDTGWDAE